MVNVRFAPMKEGIMINNELVFQLPNSKTIFIRPEAIKKMENYVQINSDDTEAGGILIGRILLENENYIVDDVSEPMPSDIRKRNRFVRKPFGHQEYFNNAWKRENGTCFYLGEWHTHPERIPVPSSVDLENWKNLLSMGFESDFLFFIILGTDVLKIWAGSSDDKKIFQLKRRGNLD